MLAALASTPAPEDPPSVLAVGDRPDPEVPEGWTTVTEVVVHGVVVGTPGWTGDETLDPERTLFSELPRVSMAEKVAVPRRNVVPKPAELFFAEAACLPTAWLTAYRMLFVRSGLRPGSTVLVQGASGGVATALIRLGSAAGYRVWVTGRSEEERAAALALGADRAFESGARQIDVELPLDRAPEGFERMLEGRTAGKIVVTL